MLEAKSATALVTWLKDNGYAFSPEVEAWAKPYVDGGWKIVKIDHDGVQLERDGRTMTLAF